MKSKLLNSDNDTRVNEVGTYIFSMNGCNSHFV